MLRHSVRAGRLIEPCLPSPAKAPPSGPDWLHEIKHDGFRILARRDAKGVRRNGHDFTKRFPLVVAAVAVLPVRSCLTSTEHDAPRHRLRIPKCGMQRRERGCYSSLIVRCPNAATR
jgi:hypothetical protein